MNKLTKAKPKPNKDSLMTLSKEVSEKLIKQILNGTYPAGSKLPTEREMAEQFHVARHIVREALKRVETLRLIKIRQGSGALVQDFTATGGLELVDLFLVKDDGRVDKAFLKDVFEFHEFTTIHTVKLAAQRRTSKEVQELKSLVEEHAKYVNDIQKRAPITLQISEMVVKASRNTYVRLLFNSLNRTTGAFAQIFEIPLPKDINLQPYLAGIVDAIEHRDPEMAALITQRGFAENKDVMMKILEKTRRIKTD
jgi:GntR family transcriptional regulator, transcriptional repressor for pyruvate dehydrogenase complex